MRRQLPCPKCGAAWLPGPDGKKIPYEMGVAPSAFRTPGASFHYTCGCEMKKAQVAIGGKLSMRETLSLSKQEFYALPDLDPPPVQPVYEPEPVVVPRPARAKPKKPAKKVAKRKKK